MKYYLLMSIFTAVCVINTGCEQTVSLQEPQTNKEQKSKQESTKNNQLLLEDDEPLLLMDDGFDIEQSDKPAADNSRCFVCHINYMQEDIAVIHSRENIGCADCHGESDAHIADESWASGGNGTPPDIMYPRPKINPFCLGCHKNNIIDTEQHEALFDADAEQKYCTDCHGDHRLFSRKCKWK